MMRHMLPFLLIVLSTDKSAFAYRNARKAVEVPANVDKFGVHAISMGRLPSGFLGLLTNQIGVHDMTAEAILNKSREAALQALLVDPIVNRYKGIEDMLDTMIEYQQQWLGYLK